MEARRSSSPRDVDGETGRHAGATRTLLRATKLLWWVAFAATLAWALGTLGTRPIDGVEGDVLFEAMRLRHGQPLYIDPAVGAFDYGSVPARYLVLYPPLWPTVLALFPERWALVIGRMIALTAWLGLLLTIVKSASAQRRATAAYAALFIAGVWTLALYGASARPDAIAVFCSGFALLRTVRRNSKDGIGIDAVSGVLFALAAWVKPNVIGIAPGVFLAALLPHASLRGSSFLSRLRTLAPGLVAALCTSLCIGGILALASRSLWLTHLLASTGQPPNFELWVDQLRSRLPFFGLPLALTAAVGVQQRERREVLIALGALLSACFWCVLSLAKIGSATNYFLEPAVAALVVIANTDKPARFLRYPLLFAAFIFTQSMWTDVASIRSSVEGIHAAYSRANLIANVRAVCGASPSELVIADEPGLELMMNGRIIATPFQSTHLARAGRFPVESWIADVTHTEVKCLLMQNDLLERSFSEANPVHDRFGDALRRALKARFTLVAARDGYWIYRAHP